MSHCRAKQNHVIGVGLWQRMIRSLHVVATRFYQTDEATVKLVLRHGALISSGYPDQVTRARQRIERTFPANSAASMHQPFTDRSEIASLSWFLEEAVCRRAMEWNADVQRIPSDSAMRSTAQHGRHSCHYPASAFITLQLAFS